MSERETCQAIVAEFVFGPKRCGEPAVTTAIDAVWGDEWPVCAEHGRNASS